MVQVAKRGKTATNKPSVPGSKKRNVGIEASMFGGLLDMVEDIFGPDPHRSAKK
ncbi:MAG: hypothetical protein IID18_00995 [Nitrospinae bacterium]|nr:hypothetical protein [Nitrospinota bacterium]